MFQLSLRLSLTAFFLMFLVLGFSQSEDLDFKKSKKELNKNKTEAYVLYAEELAVKYARNNLFSEATEFAELGMKKASKQEYEFQFLTHILEQLSVCCSDNPKQLLFGLNLQDYTIDLDLSSAEKEELLTVLTQINGKVSAPAVVAKIYELTESLTSDESALQNLKKNSYSEKQKQSLKAQLREKRAEMENLNLEAAKSALLLEYNARMLDSLAFKSAIDSAQQSHMEAQLVRKNEEIELVNSKNRLKNIMLVAVACFLALLLRMFIQTKKYNKLLGEQKAEVEREKKRADKLLSSILPDDVAEELKLKGTVTPKLHPNVTVMFLDFIGFSGISKKLTTRELIMSLNECFSEFDNLCEKWKVDKIKTIGDAYMCIGHPTFDHKESAQNVIHLALDIQEYLTKWNKERKSKNLPVFEARIGIHTGEIAAGVVGSAKFAYDVWGDTVNKAARMESVGAAGRVNISEGTQALVHDHFRTEHRGKVAVKNMGELSMYFIAN